MCGKRAYPSVCAPVVCICGVSLWSACYVCVGMYLWGFWVKCVHVCVEGVHLCVWKVCTCVWIVCICGVCVYAGSGECVYMWCVCVECVQLYVCGMECVDYVYGKRANRHVSAAHVRARARERENIENFKDNTWKTD